MSKLTKLIEQFLASPPEARFDDVQYVLEAFGFQEKRSKGSHHIFGNSLGQVVTIPKKSGKKVKRVYINKVVELLNLQEWQSNADAKDEL